MQSSSLRGNVAAGFTQSFPLCWRWFILQEIFWASLGGWDPVPGLASQSKGGTETSRGL